MSDDFKENLRKAAGIKTQAERLAEEDTKRLEAEEWDRNTSVRDGILTDYNTRVAALIQIAFTDAVQVAKEAEISLIEAPGRNAISRILVQRTFHLTPQNAKRAGSRPVTAASVFMNVQGTLHLSLDHEGMFSYEVPKSATISGVPVRTPIAQVDNDVIQAAFTDLLSRLNPAI